MPSPAPTAFKNSTLSQINSGAVLKPGSGLIGHVAYEDLTKRILASDGLRSAPINAVDRAASPNSALEYFYFDSGRETSGTRSAAHKCRYCEKSFFGSVDKERHERTHTGERPFACHVCNYRSTQLGNLTRHMKTMHADCPPTSKPS